MVRAVRCDSNPECRHGEDENGCDTDLGIVAGELTIRDISQEMFREAQETCHRVQESSMGYKLM